MRVKKLISFYENQHYFTILFVHNFLSRWLNESFRFFCISHVKIQEKWFILVHFTKSLFLFFFVAYRAASILALASSTSELLIELRGWYKNKDNFTVIKMVYNIAFTKKVINKVMKERVGLNPRYWGFFRLTDAQFDKLLELGEIPFPYSTRCWIS